MDGYSVILVIYYCIRGSVIIMTERLMNLIDRQ
jgi:hypothetical protein